MFGLKPLITPRELSASEKKLLLLCSPLIVVMLCYLGIKPLISKINSANVQVNSLIQDINQLGEDHAYVAKLSTHCSSTLGITTLTSDSYIRAIEQLTQRSQISLSVAQKDEATILLTLESTNGNKVLKLLEDSVCLGLSAESIRLTVQDNHDQVSGEISLGISERT